MVTSTRITIAQHEYDLAKGEHARRLKRRVARAVRRGGGFIALVLRGGRRISVLVTPQTVVAVETTRALPLPDSATEGFDDFFIDETTHTDD